MNKTGAILLGVAGVILFSAKAVMVKLAYHYDVDALSLLLFRMLFALPIYIIIIALLPRNTDVLYTKKDYVLLVLFGILGYYIASYFDFLGLQYIKASLERIILFMYPTLVLFISRIFLGIKINRWQVLAIGVSYFGIVLTFSQEIMMSEYTDQVVLGSLLVLTSALTYAAYLVGSGYLIPKFGSVRFTAYAMCLACICVIVHYGVQSDKSIFSYEAEVYYYGLAMAVFATVLPSFLVSEAIKHIGANNFGIIGSLGPISTILLANIFLDERMTMLQIIGTLIVIGGIFILIKNKSKLKNEASQSS